MKKRAQLELAKAEYLQIQKIIDAFDSRSFTGKAWSVMFGMAAIGAAFAFHSKAILLVAAFGALLFWVIDGYWRSIHNGYYGRLEELEIFFRDIEQPLIPMQTASSWYASFHARPRSRTARAMVRPHVAFPHAPVLVVALLLFLAAWYGLIFV